MKSSFKVSLKANERIYINGAVIKVDRKTSLEFLNDVQFLLENHVLQADEATTPLKQLYFVAQLLVMSPKDADVALDLFRKNLSALTETFTNPHILSELKIIDELIRDDKIYIALRSIRALYPHEEKILSASKAAHQAPGHIVEQPQPQLAAG